MSYSRRQLEVLGEPFGSCATRVKPGGYGRIYGLGNEPAPEGSTPSGEDYYYQTGTMAGSGQFMVPNPEYKGAEYVPYTGEGGPSGDDYYYQTGTMAGSGQFMVPNPEYQADVPAYVPYVAPTTTATSTTTGGGGTTTGGNVTAQTTQLLQDKLGTAPTQDQVNYWGGIFGLDNVITSDEVARLDAAIGNTGRTPGTSPTGNAIVSGGGGATAGVVPSGGNTLFSGSTDQIRNYISGLYTNELQRPADEGGLKFWTDNIAADGKVTQQELDAWRAAATANKETLTTQQQQQQVNQGGQQQVNQGGQQQVNQGGTAPPPGFLGARPQFTGERNPFYAGPDARSDLVNMAYQRLLNRQPDTGGLASYSQEMMRGLTGQGLVSALANSPEFQRTQDFQRAYTSTFRPGYREFGPSGQYNQPIYMGSYTNYARSPEFAQPLYNTTMMTPQDVGYGFGSFNPFAYGGTNQFAGDTAAPTGGTATGGGSTAAARGGRIKNDDGIAALLKR